MTAELVRGQNHPLSQVRLEIRISAGTPVVAGATLGDEHGRVQGVEGVAHPGAPALPGLEVSRQAAADHRLAVDLAAVPEAVHRVSVLLALPDGTGGPVRFGLVAAPFVAVTGLDGTEIASYTITGLDAESAVVALELYRRAGAWKVRAVGQGYAGGLAELLADQGLPEARQLAAGVDEAVSRGLARSVQAPRPRPADGDRSRQPAARGPEHGETPAQGGAGSVAPQPVPQQGLQSPYGPQAPVGPGQPGQNAHPGGATPADPAGPPSSGPADPSALTPPGASATPPGTPSVTQAAATGPIDYTHP
ncbi:export associated protein, partial [Streptomyces adustus]